MRPQLPRKKITREFRKRKKQREIEMTNLDSRIKQHENGIVYGFKGRASFIRWNPVQGEKVICKFTEVVPKVKA